MAAGTLNDKTVEIWVGSATPAGIITEINHTEVSTVFFGGGGNRPIGSVCGAGERIHCSGVAAVVLHNPVTVDTIVTMPMQFCAFTNASYICQANVTVRIPSGSNDPVYTSFQMDTYMPQ